MKQNPLIAGFRRGRSRATPVTTAVITCLAISWAWVGLGSATATTAKPSFHGWWQEGAAAKASAGSTIASVKADAARTGSQVLLLYAHQVQNVYIDVGDASFSPGDYFMFVQQLRYSQGGAVVGRKAARCTIGPSSYICDGTVQIFGKGKITTYAGGFPHRDNRSAVTGGTGLYQGVGGQSSVVGLGGNNSLQALEIKR